ncbi:MAG: hypothetical protein MOGMAGMI_00970 [Candidatus Omnitrophica bacterium]|nr:hypothetical protein [Candidatus Omnitrophota bacterium]
MRPRARLHGIPLAFLACIVASAAQAEEVTIDTRYPSRWGEHATASATRGVRIENPYTANAASATIFGDVTVNGAATLTNTLLRVAPNRGPYGDDGLRINAAGQVAIGNNAAVNSLLTVHTRIKTRNFYAFEWDTSITDWVYAYGESAHNAGLPLDTGKQAFFGARRSMTTQTNFADDVYTLLRIEGDEVHLGIVDPILNALGYVTWVGIGMDRDENLGEINPLPAPDDWLLEVNGPAAYTTFFNYSSRAFKSDIRAVGPDERASLLRDVRSTPLYTYRYKSAPDTAHLGPVAEESPTQVLSGDGKHLSLTDTLAVLTAALQQLQAENEELTARLEALEKRRVDHA